MPIRERLPPWPPPMTERSTDQPTGQPPPGGWQPPFGPPQPPVGRPPPGWGRAASKVPSGWWYAVPAGLLIAGMLLVAVVLLVMRSDLQAAGDGDQVGPSDTGVSVRLVSGYRYQVFRESAGTAAKANCTVATETGSNRRQVTLGDASKSYRDDKVSSGGQDYVFLGDFISPLAGDAKLTCPGQSKTLLVRPDDRPFLTVALVVLVALLLAVLALIAFIVVLVVRVRRSRQAMAAAGPG